MMIFDPVKFGKRLKELRSLHGLTQEQLAEKLNITLDHLKRLENGRNGCSIDLLMSISETLSVSSDYLLFGKTNHDEERRKILEVIGELSSVAEKL